MAAQETITRSGIFPAVNFSAVALPERFHSKSLAWLQLGQLSFFGARGLPSILELHNNLPPASLLSAVAAHCTWPPHQIADHVHRAEAAENREAEGNCYLKRRSTKESCEYLLFMFHVWQLHWYHARTHVAYVCICNTCQATRHSLLQPMHSINGPASPSPFLTAP